MENNQQEMIYYRHPAKLKKILKWINILCNVIMAVALVFGYVIATLCCVAASAILNEAFGTLNSVYALPMLIVCIFRCYFSIFATIPTKIYIIKIVLTEAVNRNGGST